MHEYRVQFTSQEKYIYTKWNNKTVLVFFSYRHTIDTIYRRVFMNCNATPLLQYQHINIITQTTSLYVNALK
jgi:hypothetical protein